MENNEENVTIKTMEETELETSCDEQGLDGAKQDYGTEEMELGNEGFVYILLERNKHITSKPEYKDYAGKMKLFSNEEQTEFKLIYLLSHKETKEEILIEEIIIDPETMTEITE